MAQLRDIFEKQKPQAVEDYFTFLKFESISSEPEYKNKVLDCCEWLKDYIQKMGFKVEIWETPYHPVLFAHYFTSHDKPTLLIYNHYDVQPVDPLDKWQSPPFEPTVRNGQVFARGAQDNKGQCFYTLLALKALLEKKWHFTY
jgi:acetylornithine deacetylase/succinyl-diaminopimelate desuccinylase-like protein